MTGVGYNADGNVVLNYDVINANSSSSVAAVVEAGILCNNARIHENQLLGQPTEGALLALAMKVNLTKIHVVNISILL